MSPQLDKSGGRNTPSVLANTFETVIGAVMMDSGYPAARKVSLALLSDSLDRVESLTAVNYKGALLETLQAINNCGPEYAVEAVGEDAGMGPFRATVTWCGILLGSAEGPSKHKAEMAAAKDAMQHRRWEK